MVLAMNKYCYRVGYYVMLIEIVDLLSFIRSTAK
jgi:hypothetical protein